MLDFQTKLHGESQTLACAKELAASLDEQLKIYFSGEIGAGKSCFIRALLKNLGVGHKIKSPTFSIIETYHVDERIFVHADLYRIADEEELNYLGLDDYERDDAMFLIEWAEKAPGLPKPDLQINLFSVDFGQNRNISIQSMSKAGEKVLSRFLEN